MTNRTAIAALIAISIGCSPSASPDAGVDATVPDASTDGATRDGGLDSGSARSACTFLRPSDGDVLRFYTQDESGTAPGFQFRALGITDPVVADRTVNVWADGFEAVVTRTHSDGFFSAPGLQLPEEGPATVCARVSGSGICCIDVQVIRDPP